MGPHSPRGREQYVRIRSHHLGGPVGRGRSRILDGVPRRRLHGRLLLRLHAVLRHLRARSATEQHEHEAVAHPHAQVRAQRDARQGQPHARRPDVRGLWLLKGTAFDFSKEWEDQAVLSEANTEKELNKDGLRYRMAPTEKEKMETGRTGNSFGQWANIWEAFGFTATSNNEARQEEKIKAAAKAKEMNNEERDAYLKRYGYPRLVGTKGIFYADQLSSDKKPMGGFNMGKSGVMWGVPDVVEDGAYGGEKGWGMKAATRGKK